jgi:hypothetical protein
LFGRDCVGGDHDFGEDSSKEVSVSEFFEEVFRLLVEKGLV